MGNTVKIREVANHQRVLCTYLMELGPVDTHMYMHVPIREVLTFQRVLCTGLNGIWT